MALDLNEAEPETVDLSSLALARIDAAIGELIEAGELAGAVILIARRGRLVRWRAMGMKDLATREPLQKDTIFRIYSMTKPVTGVAMMILYDQGLWRPEDPISKFIPGFAGAKVLKSLGVDSDAVLEDADHAPTMGELMTHTAGLSYGLGTDQIDQLYKKADVWGSTSLPQFAARVASLPLAYQPGSKWRYSLSMDLQGAIIEHLSGESLPDFMHKRIFAPLGMADTSFYVIPEKRARLATLYRMNQRRGLTPIERLDFLVDPAEPTVLACGGAGLASTAIDYARFAQMLLNRGEAGGVRIIEASSADLMMTNHLSPAVMNGGFGVGSQLIRPGFGHGFNGAVFTDPRLAGLPVGEGTYQWDGAAGTWFWVDPKNELLFVGLIQRMGGPDAPPMQAMTQTLMGEAFL
jgi:CubicO group peptidase (beta-lactamase class C family)